MNLFILLDSVTYLHKLKPKKSLWTAIILLLYKLYLHKILKYLNFIYLDDYSILWFYNNKVKSYYTFDDEDLCE